MTKKKSTKRALLMSALALLMCVSMLVGSTFAWFTDSVTSSGNKIVAGKLDVELHMYDGSGYTNISNSTSPIFDSADGATNSTKTLWEPGKTQVAYLMIKNNGNLALKYTVALDVTNVTNNMDKAMKYVITPDAKGINGVLAWDGTNAKSVKLGTQVVSTADVAMQPGDEHYFALSVHMDENAGNEYQEGQITFDLKVLATQLAAESDSFGNQYDADAVYPESVSNTVKNPQGATEDVTFETKDENGNATVTVEVPKNVLNAIPGEVESIQFVHSEPKVDAVAGTITFDTADIVDQNGNPVDLRNNTEVLAVKLPAPAGFADGETVYIYHDGELVATPIVTNGQIAYETNHFCEIIVSKTELVNDEASLKDAIADGGEITLVKDIVLGSTIEVANGVTVVLDLNGKTISQKKGDIGAAYAMIDNKGTLTIKDSVGTGKISFADTTPYAADINWASNTIRNTGVLNITGGTVENITAEAITNFSYPHAIDCYQGSVTNISGGTVKSLNYDAIRMFCNSDTQKTEVNISGGNIINRVSFQDPSSTRPGCGVLKITGGTFTTTEGVTSNVRLLNFCNANDRNMKAIVTGGTFDKGFKTQNHSSATVKTSDWLTINGAPAVSTADELIAALANGGNVVLTDDIEMESATTAPYGNKYAVKFDGGVLDGNGNELYMECYGDDYGVMTTGGTIKNITIKEGCRAVMIMYPQSDVILDNVNIGGDGVLYPINTGEGGAAGVDLIVTNSTLAGWTSYGLIESASFTNVKFEQGTYYNNIYGRVLKPYVNTTLTDCSFVKAMNLDLSSLEDGHKITIENCTVDGQKVTAETFTIPTTDAQYDTELFTVDLPSWASSINDCIVFAD